MRAGQGDGFWPGHEMVRVSFVTMMHLWGVARPEEGPRNALPHSGRACGLQRSQQRC